MHAHLYNMHMHAHLHNVHMQVGVLLHQWDGLEEWGTPWQMCITSCMCQGAFINGRISSMIVYRDLSKRPDRVGNVMHTCYTHAYVCMHMHMDLFYDHVHPT